MQGRWALVQSFCVEGWGIGLGIWGFFEGLKVKGSLCGVSTILHVAEVVGAPGGGEAASTTDALPGALTSNARLAWLLDGPGTSRRDTNEQMFP